MSATDFPQPVPASNLPRFFTDRGVAYSRYGRLQLGFGPAQPQYRFFDYSLPGPGQTMGIFLEWYTEDFFNSPHGPHLAVGLRGPLESDPHRGRGLAIGILASHAPDPSTPGHMLPLFAGCPEPPGGPAFFIEDFSINEGTAPVTSWQMSRCQNAENLGNAGTYRIDIHVSTLNVWTGIWKRQPDREAYLPVGQASCCDGSSGEPGGCAGPCPELPADTGMGNAFIGTGFADPDNRSYIDNIFIAHWPETPGAKQPSRGEETA